LYTWCVETSSGGFLAKRKGSHPLVCRGEAEPLRGKAKRGSSQARGVPSGSLGEELDPEIRAHQEVDKKTRVVQ